ncbi:MAG: FMN-binding protein [Phycisphaerales bacterium]
MLSKIKFFMQQSWLLLLASFLFGLMIAVADTAWKPKVEENKTGKVKNMMKGLINANSFEVAAKDVNIPSDKGFIKTDIYKAVDEQGNVLGYEYITSGSGFGDKIELIIAVDAKCEKYLGYQVLSSNETPGFGDKIKGDYFSKQFVGAPAAEFTLVKVGKAEDIDNQIVAISGATITSTAMVNIFNKSIVSVKETLAQKGLIK